MTPPPRPALAAVLTALSECHPDTVRNWLIACAREHRRPSVEVTESGGAGVCVRGHFPDGSAGWLFPLRDASPAAALASLVEAELLPDWWQDPDRAPRWWCPACEGSGRTDYDPASDPIWRWCRDCDGLGWASQPTSHAALVEVASLGVAALSRAHAVVEDGWAARVAWRSARAEWISEHHAETTARIQPGRRVGVAETFSRERYNRAPIIIGVDMPAPWSEVWRPHGIGPKEWRAMREIDDMGMHVLAHDAGEPARMVLGVESLP